MPFIKYNERFDLNRTEDRKTGVWGGWWAEGNGATRKVRLDTKMSYEKTKISVERQIMEMTKEDGMAATKQETQLRESSVNAAICRFVGQKHGLMANLPLSAQISDAR